MSVRFDQQAGAQSLEAAYPPPNVTGGLRLTGVPVSVTVWIYLDSGDVPGAGERATIWWFGVAGQAGNFLLLEAVPGTTGGFNLEASLVGQAALGPVLKQDLAAGVWHCVSVVLAAGGQTTLTLSLYADGDGTPASATGSGAGVDPTLWDTFSLARNRSAGADNRGAFSFEHAAVWAAALGPFDTASMFTQRIPPRDGHRLTVGGPPDFSYWFCTAHVRSGIEVRNRVDGWPLDGGEFYNQSTPTGQEQFPQLRIPAGDAAATWSASTPVLRYDDVQAMQPIAGRVIHPPGRLQPHFWFFNDTGVNEFPEGDEELVTPEVARSYGFYTDPNMSRFGQADYRSGNQLWPPVPENDRAVYVPTIELALSAKRLADWFAFMGLVAGVGTGPGGRYAGCVYVRGVGLGGEGRPDQVRGLSATFEFVRTDTGSAVTHKGLDSGIPLEQHPRDWSLLDNKPEVRAPWATWFRQGGVALVRQYMAHFWLALKAELDDRGLCYPLRVHFDYEGWPRDTDQLSILSGRQVGVWPDAAADARAGTEDLLNYGGSTLDALSAGVGWDAGSGMYTGANNDFQQWWNGLSVVLRLQALSESVFADMAGVFPLTRWSNFRGFVADDPAFAFPDGNEFENGGVLVRRWLNTPVDDAQLAVAGDFSSPELYSNENLLRNLQGNYQERIGYSAAEVVRDYNRTRLDAVFAARNAKPVVPWMENVGRVLTDEGPPGQDAVTHVVSFEDIKSLLAYAWQRGTDEFIMFTFNPTIQRMRDGVVVAGWLRDWVHMLPQAAQDHAARGGRLGRRTM